MSKALYLLGSGFSISCKSSPAQNMLLLQVLMMTPWSSVSDPSLSKVSTAWINCCSISKLKLLTGGRFNVKTLILSFSVSWLIVTKGPAWLSRRNWNWLLALKVDEQRPLPKRSVKLIFSHFSPGVTVEVYTNSWLQSLWLCTPLILKGCDNNRSNQPRKQCSSLPTKIINES